LGLCENVKKGHLKICLKIANEIEVFLGLGLHFSEARDPMHARYYAAAASSNILLFSRIRKYFLD
jgi:hypothetical protein